MTPTFVLTLSVSLLLLFPSTFAKQVTPLAGEVFGPEIKITPDDPVMGDQFGSNLAISGDTAVVTAAIGNSLSIHKGGLVYVFVRGENGWVQQQKLSGEPETQNSSFGVGLAIDGDTIVVGDQNVVSGGALTGAAYVFQRQGTVWSLQQKLIPDQGGPDAEFSSFGQAIAIQGDTIIVGAPLYNTASNFAGAAFVYVRSGDTWTQTQKLTANDVAAEAVMGVSVAISGDTAVFGAVGDSINGRNSGAAYVFTRQNGLWSQQQKLKAHDPSENALFGQSVSASGDIIVVGAPGDIVGNHTVGAAYIFRRGNAGWTNEKKLLSRDSDAVDGYGWTVAVDGNTIVVGHFGDQDVAIVGGAAYVYQLNGNSGWSLKQKLIASDTAQFHNFGFRVAISGETILIGAHGDDRGGGAFDDFGAAYIYEALP
ncbi:MAG TPA: FG-GAP repeat protein [Pyrinomonadaceae bacterium]|nr:FG-GAP repeat protein [Pyrinomonadaceae bacterium]